MRAAWRGYEEADKEERQPPQSEQRATLNASNSGQCGVLWPCV
jgi:hypothetical protein